MRNGGIAVCLLTLLTTQVLSRPQNTPKNPPASVVARAWQIIAAEGPIDTKKFTSVSINWNQGAYYMMINGGQQNRWKLMITPPLGESDWRVQVLRVEPRREKLKKGSKNLDALDSRVARSRSFATAFSSLPQMFTEAKSFQVRAILEKEQVVFFLETTTSIPAWITFKVDPSGKFVILDRGF